MAEQDADRIIDFEYSFMDPNLSTQSADRLSTSYSKGFTLLTVHIVMFVMSYYITYVNILIVYTTVLMMSDKYLIIPIILLIPEGLLKQII